MPAIKGKPVLCRQKRVILNCSICDAQYSQHEYRSKTSKFCSKKCWSTRNPVPNKECPFCHKVFHTRNREQIFCNRSCAAKPRTGEKAGAWKGGVTLGNERARVSNDLRKWRESVFKRDNFLCQTCGNGGKLHAHHIKSFSEFPDLRLDILNGITLCIKCHGVVHGKNFENVKIKTCGRCGIETKGRGKMCRSCAITLWHSKKSQG